MWTETIHFNYLISKAKKYLITYKRYKSDIKYILPSDLGIRDSSLFRVILGSQYSANLNI